jgi:hypothetical protein
LENFKRLFSEGHGDWTSAASRSWNASSAVRFSPNEVGLTDRCLEGSNSKICANRWAKPLNFSEVRIEEWNWTYCERSIAFGESLYLIFQFGFY